MPIGDTVKQCRETPIERVARPTPEVFQQRYLAGAGKPVIITDAMDTWKARATWNFDLFKSRYGSDGVVAAVWPGDKWLKAMTLKAYLEYLDAPAQPSAGFWLDPSTKLPSEQPPEPPSVPLYLTGWRSFELHPELLADVEISPKFIDDWLPLLPQPFRKVLDRFTRYFSSGVLLGPPGATAMLHQDFLHTHAYLAQIAGRKICTLFPPDDAAFVYEGQVELPRPDLDRFPLYRNASAFHCILEPGEMLFIPSRWWHHVVAMEKSITVNYNFFNRVNFGAYITDLLTDMPTIVRGLEKYPEAKASLGIHWTSKDFDVRPENE